jgi:glycosyltransferase involved in cell wall biosynthesis
MKIINVIENLDDTYGGPAKSVPYMCKYLEDIDVDTQILSICLKSNEKNSLVERYKLNWKIFNYNFFKSFRYSVDMKRYIKNIALKEKNIILHTHNLWNYICYISLKISQKYNLPLIVSIRGSLYKWSLEQSKWKKLIAWALFQKRVLQNASCIHVTEMKELEAVRDLQIKTPIAIIPNGINLEEFKGLKTKNDAKSSLGLKNDKKYILFISRLHPKKGIEFLINSWINIANTYQDWDLLIVGPEYNKHYVDDLRSKIIDSQLSERVVFTGMLEGDERLDSFAASSLFVLPSYSENFGVAIAEAMAAKLPIITTHGTPWKEINIYKAGWWVELNQDNIDYALNQALACSEHELGLKGLNGLRLIEKYEWKYQATKMKELYEYIINGKHKPDFLYEFGDKN